MILKRIKEYIDNKRISTSAFEKAIGMSNNSFRKSLLNNGSIGTDKLGNILIIYPDLNPIWLLTGEGEMLKTVCGDTVELKAAPLHNEIIELLKSQLAEKEKKIDELNKAIGRLESEIDKDKSPERNPKLADRVASKS